MKPRPHPTAAGRGAAAHRPGEALVVVPVIGPDPDRGPSRLVRADLRLWLDPAAPAGPGQRPRGLR